MDDAKEPPGPAHTIALDGDRPYSEDEYDQLVEAVASRAWAYACHTFNVRTAALVKLESQPATPALAAEDGSSSRGWAVGSWREGGCSNQPPASPPHLTPDDEAAVDDAQLWDAAVAGWGNARSAASSAPNCTSRHCMRPPPPPNHAGRAPVHVPVAHTLARKAAMSSRSGRRSVSGSSYLSAHLARSAGADTNSAETSRMPARARGVGDTLSL
jgi:hypothetical protein